MRKVIVLIGLIILITINTKGQKHKDFRTFEWNSSFEKVIENEKSLMIDCEKIPSSVIYQDYINDRIVRVKYIFNRKKKLVNGVYTFENCDSAFFKDVTKTLNKKYTYINTVECISSYKSKNKRTNILIIFNNKKKTINIKYYPISKPSKNLIEKL